MDVAARTLVSSKLSINEPSARLECVDLNNSIFLLLRTHFLATLDEKPLWEIIIEEESCFSMLISFCECNFFRARLLS